ncbi:DnaB-like helicase C-terminal domain-containing protein [Streptomyces sp. NPDC007355]|uniref:DnaB-like helicase C-terminal domain-containing protein n=1 Tax=Streptomyces sp. NPDC007355 TaxID=3364778 RepID=UPI0036C5FD9C
MSDRSVPPDATNADPGPMWVGAGPDGTPEVLRVSVARTQLYPLVDKARDGVVTVVTKGTGRTEVRAALVSLKSLDAAARAQVGGWPSLSKTAARPKLGDLVAAAAGSGGQGTPGTPQVLLDYKTPVAVLVDAALLPDDGGPIRVPAPGRRQITLSVREVTRDWTPLLDEAEAGEVWVEVYQSRSTTAPRAVLIPVVALNPEHAGLLEMWPVHDADDILGELDALVEEVAKPTAQDTARGVVVARKGKPLAVLMARNEAARATAHQPGATPPADHLQADAAAPEELPAAPVGTGTSVASVAVGWAAAEALPEADAPPAAQPTANHETGTGAVSRRPVAALEAVLQEVLAPQGPGTPPTEAASFGIRALDRVVAGLQPGKLTLVAGAPGAGPSLLVAAAARDTALRRQLPVLYAASGLTRTDVAMRVIAAEAGVNYRALRTGRLTEHEQDKANGVGELLSRLGGNVWHIDDGAGLTASDIAEAAQDIDGLALVVVDRLQRAHDPSVPLSGRALPAAAQALTHVARRLKVPVVAAVDTDETPLVAALDADVTLTVTRTDERADITYAERDFGILASTELRADLACARFTDPLEAAEPTAPQAVDPNPPTPTVTPSDAITDETEHELLQAAHPFISGAAEGIGARLRGTLSALGQAARTGNHGDLDDLRASMADLAARHPTVPDTNEGRRLAAALTAYAAARPPMSAADSAPRPERPTALAPDSQDTPAVTKELGPAEAELIAAALPLLTEDGPLSLTARSALSQLRDALRTGDDQAIKVARARTASLAGQRLRLPHTDEAQGFRAALETFARAAAAAGITSAAVPVPVASLTVQELARDTEHQALDDAPYDADEETSATFQDTTVPPEDSGNVRRGRTYTFFTNKIAAAVDQALQETNGDIDEAIKLLKRKAVPDAMALFKLSRVGATYEHSVYPEPLEFLSKPSQKESDQIWEGRHKWRNETLRTAVKKGMQRPLDVTALDTNCAYLSAFKTHLPIGALRHHTRGFLPKESGIHRVDHFEWPHEDLPNPLGGRVEPGPYLLDEATVRLLIRCHELDLSDPPRILESWTSGGTEALLEKFRRILNEARTKAIQESDKPTEEYVKAMYSRFTSTIGESGKNQELRRADWVHIIRSQAFASLWLKAHRAHQEGITLVQVSGVDEIHLVGDWQKIWKEGRMPGEMKKKRLYTLGGN